MKKNRYPIIAFLFSYILVSGLTAIPVQGEDLELLLAKITNRINAYPENNNWEYKLNTKSVESDEQWQPKKTTTTKVAIKVIDSMASGILLEAVETEDGKTKDISKKLANQLKEQIENANKETQKRKDQKVHKNEYDLFFPFNVNKIARYDFKRLNDTVINEKPVYLIEAIAKEKDEKLFEGKYYIDKNTCDILKAQVAPSKNPKFVNEMHMDIDFTVLPEGNFIRIKSRTRVNAGFLFKRIKMILEEEYFDVKIGK